MEPTSAPATAEPLHQLDIAQQAVLGLEKAFGNQLCAVVLFGSRARGDFHPHSDWDFLVIAEGLPETTWDRYQIVKAALPPEARGVSAVLAKTPEEFESRLPALYLDIGLDGRVLYERDGYASERLARLQRIIERAGLYRERTPAGDAWKWRDPPRGHWSIDWDSSRMASAEDANYRLRLTEGFLAEARQDAGLSRWRSCVDNSQLAAENAAKAVLAQLGPVARSHGASDLLRRAHASGAFPADLSERVERLIELSQQLGWDVHIASDYGDETEHRTPWEMFDETAARKALAAAEEGLTMAQSIVSAGR